MSNRALLASGIAAVAAGAMSMAVGEYVSVSTPTSWSVPGTRPGHRWPPSWWARTIGGGLAAMVITYAIGLLVGAQL